MRAKRSHLTKTFTLIALSMVARPPVDGMQVASSLPSSPRAYNLSVSVDEVTLSLHASDSAGLPVNDLHQDELRLRDNGKPPQRIISFEYRPDLPIRAGILIDTSRSVLEDLHQNQAVAIEYAGHSLRAQTDQAFVMRFDSSSRVLRNWTNNSAQLTSSIRSVAADYQTRLGGTILYDALYRACRDQIGSSDPGAHANLIMLFTDGEDNASHARLKDDIDICQKTNTSIYVFSAEPRSRFAEGQKMLGELTAQTGGQMFFDSSPAAISSELRIMEAELRSQYWIAYKPLELTHDGSFHRIKFKYPKRVARIAVRSGYYAPGP